MKIHAMARLTQVLAASPLFADLKKEWDGKIVGKAHFSVWSGISRTWFGAAQEISVVWTIPVQGSCVDTFRTLQADVNHANSLLTELKKKHGSKVVSLEPCTEKQCKTLDSKNSSGSQQELRGSITLKDK